MFSLVYHLRFDVAACLLDPVHSTISMPSLRRGYGIEEVRTNKGNNSHNSPIPANFGPIGSSVHHVQVPRQTPPIIRIRRGTAIVGGLNCSRAMSNRHEQ